MDPLVSRGRARWLCRRASLTADTSFFQAFLLTFRSFTTGSELVELLFDRYMLEAPDSLDERQYAEWKKMKQTPIRLRYVTSWLVFDHADVQLTSGCQMCSARGWMYITSRRRMRLCLTRSRTLHRRPWPRREASFYRDSWSRSCSAAWVLGSAKAQRKLTAAHG